MQLPRDPDNKLSAYAWPGGYPVYYLDASGSVLCPACARRSDEDPEEIPQFRPSDAGINYEDASLFCDECSERIESAYAED